ncbi:MAG: hypothetical protein JWO15_970 [Sphingomonadales bacterium]|nr:hypothetical protein [Sphingomonadales bacterium]
MRGGILPPGLLCVALGLALAFALPRQAWRAVAVLVPIAVCVWWFQFPPKYLEIAFLGCWISVIATAGLVHLPGSVPSAAAIFAGANAGFWSGGLSSLAGSGRDLMIALLCTLVFLPARALVVRGWGIGPKIVASWLMAIAVLASMLPLTPTPGYVPDHME